MKPRQERIPQAVTLVNFLALNPDSTIAEIQDALSSQHGGVSSWAHDIIHYVRNVVGAEVLVCRYNARRGAYTYRLATTAADAYDYVVGRKRKVRNEAANLVAILDRTEAKYPGDADIRMARAMLASVVMVLDAGSGK